MRGRQLTRSYVFATHSLANQISALQLKDAPTPDANRAQSLVLLEHMLDLLKLMTADYVMPMDFLFDHAIDACVVRSAPT